MLSAFHKVDFLKRLFYNRNYSNCVIISYDMRVFLIVYFIKQLFHAVVLYIFYRMLNVSY